MSQSEAQERPDNDDEEGDGVDGDDEDGVDGDDESKFENGQKWNTHCIWTVFVVFSKRICVFWSSRDERQRSPDFKSHLGK